MLETILTAAIPAIITGLAAILATRWNREKTKQENHELKITIDGRMEQLLEVTRIQAGASATLAEKAAQLVRDDQATHTVNKTAEAAAAVVKEVALAALAVRKESQPITLPPVKEKEVMEVTVVVPFDEKAEKPKTTK